MAEAERECVAGWRRTVSILERVPGSSAWLLSRITPRVEHALRRELRELVRDVGATFAGTWVVAADRPVLVAFAGERAFEPVPYPMLTSTVPSWERVRDSAGDEHDAVVFPPQLGRGMPRAGVIVVDPHTEAVAVFDAVEDCGFRLEEIVVGAIAG